MKHKSGTANNYKLKRRYLQVLVQVMLWVVFLLLPGLFRPRGVPVHGEYGNNIWGDLFVFHRFINAVYLVAIFYLNYYKAIPLLYMRRRYWLFAFYVMGTFAGLVILNYLIFQTGITKRPPGMLFRFLGPSHNLLMFIIAYVGSFTLSLYEQWRKALEEKLNTEISFLKAQINPHFLFNTLNSIYSLAITKSDKAPEAIAKLSYIMRYSTSESDKEYVALSKELMYIDNYVELQRLRLSSKVKIHYEIKGEPVLKEIAPFLLIPFIENAFKHGVNAEEDSDIDIRIGITEQLLNLIVVNNKVFVQRTTDSGTGLGIDNTRKRLDLLYPGKYELTIIDGDDDFNVDLKVYWS